MARRMIGFLQFGMCRKFGMRPANIPFVGFEIEFFGALMLPSAVSTWSPWSGFAHDDDDVDDDMY